MTVLLAATLSGCDVSGGESRSGTDRGSPGSGAAAARSGPLAVREARGLRAAYVSGARVHGLAGARSPRRLATAVNAAFTGTLVPPAVPKPGNDGVLAYHALRRGRPVLRVHDAVRDRDTAIAEGAYSLAWRRDGTLAYFKALRSRVPNPERFRGHLVVRKMGRGSSRRWTSTPDRYVAAAWAAGRLLAYRLSGTSANVLVLDRPRRVRVLARDAFLIAVSPDGRRALVGGTQTTAGTTVRVVDVGTGATATAFSIRGRHVPGSRARITFVGSGGSWSRDYVVGPTNLGLVVFKVTSGRIALEQILTVDLTTFQTGIQEPRLDSSGRRIVAWGELTPSPRQPLPNAVLLACDRIARQCRHGRPHPGLQPPRPIYNPSRP
jgi:hypothetical protein